MAKAYWVACYHSISNPDALAAYAKLAGPAIAASGGRFLARGNAAKAYEAGLTERINIGAYLLWIIVLAVALLRPRRRGDQREAPAAHGVAGALGNWLLG